MTSSTVFTSKRSRTGCVGDTDEKRAIGLCWERASGGKGLFLMIEKQVDDRDMRGQLLDRIKR